MDSYHMASTCIIIIHKRKNNMQFTYQVLLVLIAHTKILSETLWTNVTFTMHSEKNNFYQLTSNFVQVETDLKHRTLLSCYISILSWHWVILWYIYNHHIYMS